jgi:beta-glucosidase
MGENVVQSIGAFPKGFAVGVATSGHQVEGGNVHSDWWEFEKTPGSECGEPSGNAVEHFTRYADDIALFARLGYTAYRFSVEWSRIEPVEGQFDSSMLEHYRRVTASCREHGLFPMITLNHFSLPAWLWRRGGWTAPDAPELFRRFVHQASRALADLAGAFCTLNEPNLPMNAFYDRHGERFHRVAGVEMPFPMCHAHEARDRQLEAHRLAVATIREHCAVPVGMSLNLHEHVAKEGGEARLAEIQRECEDVFLEAARGDDFVGVQNYGRKLIGPEGVSKWEGDLDFLGYDYAPNALEVCVRHAIALSGAACYVTEHGTCYPDDTRRVRVIDDAIVGLGSCLRDGLDVRGYFHWCAFDAFEWRLGYRLLFGAIAVDRATQERSPKPSARHLGRYAIAIARGGR